MSEVKFIALRPVIKFPQLIHFCDRITVKFSPITQQVFNNHNYHSRHAHFIHLYHGFPQA